MADKKNKEGIDHYVIRVIARKAGQLIGQAGFTESDREDIEQEIILDLLRRLPNYDPRRGRRNTLIAYIINHTISNIIQSRNSIKRDYRLQYSLEDMVLETVTEDGEHKLIERGRTVDLEEYLLRTGKKSRPISELRDLQTDVQNLISQLPPHLKDLCERLQSKSVSQISRETGIPRWSIYESLKLLRLFFEDAGLRDYL